MLAQQVALVLVSPLIVDRFVVAPGGGKFATKARVGVVYPHVPQHII